jgi:hypothetical protein
MGYLTRPSSKIPEPLLIALHFSAISQRRSEPKRNSQMNPAGLQPRVHRLTFEHQHRKGALMDPEERLAFNEPLQRFHSQGELPQSERALGAKSTRAIVPGSAGPCTPVRR